MKLKFSRRMLEADIGDGVNGADNTSNADTTTNDDQDTSNTEEVKTFTQEEVNKVIQDRITREQAKWEKKVEEEKTEAERMAKMTEAQKQKALFEKDKKEFEETKKAFEREKLLNETTKQLVDKELPAEFAEYLITETAEDTLKRMETFETKWNKAIEKQVNEKLRGGNPQKKFNNSSADYDKMSDDEYYKTIMKK